MYAFIFDIVKKTLFFTNVVKLDKTATKRRLFMSLHGLEILVLKQAKKLKLYTFVHVQQNFYFRNEQS